MLLADKVPDHARQRYVCRQSVFAHDSSPALARYCEYAPGDSPSFAERDLDGVILQRKGLSKKDVPRRVDLTEEDYMLMPVKLYGFGLADREWRKSTPSPFESLCAEIFH